MAERRSPTGEYTGSTEKITDPVRIAALLERLCANHCLLTVLPDESGEAYNSALIEIRAEQGYFVLDELNPKAGHERLLATRRLKAQARLNGVELSFAAYVESAGSRNGLGFYRVTFPASLNYFQRRRHYRAKVGLGRHVPVTLILPNGEPMTGRLRDISVGGIGVSFPPAFPDGLAYDDRAVEGSIVLPSGEEIFCRLKICFVNHSLQGDTRVVGARFVELGAAQQKTVAEFVAALDRELMKKLPRK